MTAFHKRVMQHLKDFPPFTLSLLDSHLSVWTPRCAGMGLAHSCAFCSWRGSFINDLQSSTLVTVIAEQTPKKKDGDHWSKFSLSDTSNMNYNSGGPLILKQAPKTMSECVWVASTQCLRGVMCAVVSTRLMVSRSKKTKQNNSILFSTFHNRTTMDFWSIVPQIIFFWNNKKAFLLIYA